MVAEVTQPSLGVGYELGRAVDMGKAILCLYRPQEDKLLSAMIRGMDNNDNLRQCSTKILGEGSVKNLYQSSTTLGLDPISRGPS